MDFKPSLNHQVLHGGHLVAKVIKNHQINTIFTLTGGHISPILVGCHDYGIQVVDTRHEASAVFAADSFSRLSGLPGIAVVTAGPGVTNTTTALRNALFAQSPLILIGGATATLLRGRGALQDINQIEVIRSHVKKTFRIQRIKNLQPFMEEAFYVAQSDLPGPVFVEIPVDLLYPRDTIRKFYLESTGKSQNLKTKIRSFYLKHHLHRIFHNESSSPITAPNTPANFSQNPLPKIFYQLLENSLKPLLLLGSQTVLVPDLIPELIQSLEQIGIPIYMSGMARGMLGQNHPLLIRHLRKQALQSADLILLAGVPLDFRLNYGFGIPSRKKVISINIDSRLLQLNRKPDASIKANPALSLIELSRKLSQKHDQDKNWLKSLVEADQKRESEIELQQHEESENINPLLLFQKINAFLQDNSILESDGGDFVATGSYILKPHKPLSWLDPGPFGTLGVGGGFAAGPFASRPDSEIWIIYGDGASGFSLAEFDTFRRHKMPVIAILGNDAGWSQISRDQVELLGDNIGCQLRHTDYHEVVKGFGGEGIIIQKNSEIDEALNQARNISKRGKAVLVNAIITPTDFRKGSISI
ncbi:MAG: thiamine pyrophosphate-binding protein [SAR324 cluster bacterium]|nr:thiamine pyrophosphate-binding protein [SAR324 cluster bacterium]